MILKDDKLNNNKFWTRLNVIATHLLAELLILVLVIFILSSVIKALYNVDVFDYLLSKKDHILFKLSLLLVLLYIVHDFKDRYKWLDFNDHLRDIRFNRKYPEEMTKYWINNTKSQIDIVRMKIDILKSLSPIPVIILFLGKFFDNKLTIDFNNLLVSILACLFVYFISLIKSFYKYSKLQRNLNEYQNLLLKMKRENIFRKKDRLTKDKSIIIEHQSNFNSQ